MAKIETINLNTIGVITPREVSDLTYVRSLDENQTSGSFVSTQPLVENGVLVVYPQNPNNPSYTTSTISTLKGNTSLNFPLDSKFDYCHGRLWTSDAGNNRVVCQNCYDYSVIFTCDTNYVPFCTVPNTNNAEGYVMAFSSLTTGVVYHIDTSGIIQHTFGFNLTFPSSTLQIERNATFLDSLPSPHCMVFDHVRSRLWWVALTKVYMVDTLTETVSVYDLSTEGLYNTRSISIHLESGNSFIIANDVNNDWYVVQMHRDNHDYIGKGYIASGVY